MYVGYSLGGRLCLRLALDRPDLVRGLVLMGASPGIADPGARAARRAADEALAAGIERDGVAAFLDGGWPGRCSPPCPRRRRGGTSGSPTAPAGWPPRCAGSGPAPGAAVGRLAGLRPPTLLVAGALDAKFAGIAREMAAAIGPGRGWRSSPGPGTPSTWNARPMAALISVPA